MIKLENQTLFQCSFCKKRLLTKRGCVLHEKLYCKNNESPHVINCEHENIETSYRYIPGEAVQEPDYNYCVDCGTRF